MADESQRPIIVKRIKKGGHGHHGGAWKIAYADFVTAMMAFFLLMWLLGSVSQGTLAADLNQMPNRLSISGHTDATPYGAGLTGYSNWELSADRANAARRELIAGGLGSNKVLRVVALADADPLLPGNLFAPENRRITIVVLNQQASQNILNHDIKSQFNNQSLGGPARIGAP